MPRCRIIFVVIPGAAGNFLSPASSLSSNAFKTGLYFVALVTDDTKLTVGFLHVIVLEIDTVGTYNVTKAVYEQYFKVHINSSVHVLIAKQSPEFFLPLSLMCMAVLTTTMV